jgi:transposase
MEMAEGRVIAQCLSRNRHQDFLAFLKTIHRETTPNLDLHLILDNLATHKHPTVRAWLVKHPRFHLHFIPTSSSWLNVVEIFLRELTNKRLRRGAFTSVAQLEQAIMSYVDGHNVAPEPYVWTARADAIIEKVGRGKAALKMVKQRGTDH